MCKRNSSKIKNYRLVVPTFGKDMQLTIIDGTDMPIDGMHNLMLDIDRISHFVHTQ